MENISLTYRVRNEEVLHCQGGQEYSTYNSKKGRLILLVTTPVGTASYNLLLRKSCRMRKKTNIYYMTLRRGKDTKWGNIRLQSVKNSFWKRQWTWLKADYAVFNE